MDPLVVFFDLTTKNVNGDEQTMNYQERCDVYKDDGKIVKIYARAKFGENIFESVNRLSEPLLNSGNSHNIPEWVAFLQWLESIRKANQKLILVAHNNQFFHFHILKKMFVTFGIKKSLRDNIYFFDSMALMEKIQFLG